MLLRVGLRGVNLLGSSDENVGLFGVVSVSSLASVVGACINSTASGVRVEVMLSPLLSRRILTAGSRVRINESNATEKFERGLSSSRGSLLM